jgi:hypothetical protein
MSDMYGTVLSNTFTVRDTAAFRAWFAGYYFGDAIELFIDDGDCSLCFGGGEQYPSAYPRVRDGEGEIYDADLSVFSAELCAHLADGEIFNVVAGGNEKLRYVAFSQLIIIQQCPDTPYFRCHSSDADKEELLKLALQAA